MNVLQQLSNQPTYLLWLVGGMFGLFVNLIAFEPTIAALGLAAIITAIAALTVSNIGIQFLLWGVLSVVLAILLRGMVPRESQALAAPTEAEVSVTIPSGGVGEVSYEGTLWTARCQMSDVAIAVGQQVHVVGRQGNTLVVLPTTFANPPIYEQPR